MDNSNKPPTRVATGVFGRSLKVTRMGMVGGARAAAHVVGNWVLGDKNKQAREDALWRSQVSMWVREVGQLKGSLMKAGQMLALYGEPFLPKEALDMLRTLQSDSPPLAFSSIREVLVAELGAEKVDALQIDETAIGAASLGQVHRATTPDGRELALKVQYPGVAEALDHDLKAIRRLMQVLRMVTTAEVLDALFAEVRDVLSCELDYVQEREATEFFRAQLQALPKLCVPKTFAEYSGGRVLATSYEEGVSPEDPRVLALSQARRDALGMAYFDLYLRELFILRRVQTDPHLGNFRIRIDPAGENDELVLLDFGATRAVSDDYVRTYRRMMQGCLFDKRDYIMDAGLELGLLRVGDPAQAETSFVDMCRLIAEPFSSTATPGRNDALFTKDGAYDFGNSDLPNRVATRARSLAVLRGIRPPPPETLFLDRKLAGTFLFLATLKACVDARPLLLSYLGEPVA